MYHDPIRTSLRTPGLVLDGTGGGRRRSRRERQKEREGLGKGVQGVKPSFSGYYRVTHYGTSIAITKVSAAVLCSVFKL